MKYLNCFLYIFCGLLIIGCDSSDSGSNGKVIVFAAASTTDAINSIAKEFTEQNNVVVISNFASSSALAQQIENGADADIFISANQKWADYLEEMGKCFTRSDIVSNKLVIIVPSELETETGNARVLLDSGITNIAMGDNDSVPAGIYGKEALTTLGLWEALETKVVSCKDVRSVLAFVETKSAEAGIVYSTDAALSEKVKVVYTFPVDSISKPITYPAMILTGSVENESARLFFDYLKSEPARRIFESYGFKTE